MSDPPQAVIIAQLAWMALWLIALAGLLVVPSLRKRPSEFSASLKSKWKPSLAISLVFLLAMGLGGRGVANPVAITTFCQAMIGLALASEIEGFEPLRFIPNRARVSSLLRDILTTPILVLLASLIAIVVGTIGLSIGRQMFGEISRTAQAQEAFSGNPFSAFFLFLAGSGIAEETPFRLFLASALYLWTKRWRLSIFLSAALFGLYHLTPLNGMYQLFWLFPVSQVLASTLIGLIWGYLFRRRGYEAAVLAHTLSNWLPLLIFAA